MTDFLHLPLVEVLKLLVRGSVEEYLAEKEANASARAVTTANNECESLDMKGALEFLNSNGYPVYSSPPQQGKEGGDEKRRNSRRKDHPQFLSP